MQRLQSQHVLRTSPPPLSTSIHTEPHASRCQSKECQRADWATHKLQCMLNMRTAEASGANKTARAKALRAWTAKHRPTLAACALHAVQLTQDIAHASDRILLVQLKPRRDTTRVERAFAVENAMVVRYPFFTPQQEMEMRAMYRSADAANRRDGMDGTVVAMLHDLESGVSNCMSAGFQLAAIQPIEGTWMDLLMAKVDQGIVQ